jgi:hypothetical protein
MSFCKKALINASSTMSCLLSDSSTVPPERFPVNPLTHILGFAIFPSIDTVEGKMFSRRHYLFIAEALAQSSCHPSDTLAVAKALADAFATHEEKFDRTRFLNLVQEAMSEYDTPPWEPHCGLDGKKGT